MPLSPANLTDRKKIGGAKIEHMERSFFDGGLLHLLGFSSSIASQLS